MRVKNRTGVLQRYAPPGIALPPGVWVDKVPRKLALELLRQGIVEVEQEKGYTTPENSLWHDDEGFHLVWMAPFSLADGYATASESTIAALVSQGMELFLLPCWFIVRKGLQPHTLKLLERGLPDEVSPRVGLCMATPGQFSKLPTSYRIGLTMYEADQPLKVHPEWQRNCSQVDHLFVPSEYCKSVFGHFVDRPISVVPLATNKMYNIGLTHTRSVKPDGEFTFFMHGTLTNRKAPVEMLETFRRAFPRAQYPNVRIVFKTRMGIFGRGQGQLPTLDDSRITIYDGDWFAERLLHEFKNADAYVFPSKGEGWGMTPREAMCTGLPTIISDNTALKDLANDKYNWPIPTKGAEECVLGGNWRLPDWDYLIDVMRDMVGHPKQTAVKARRGTEWIFRTNGPAAVAARWSQVFETIDPAAIRRNDEPDAEVLTGSLAGLQDLHSPFLDLIDRTVPSNGIVWDLGVGSGLLHVTLAQRAYRVYGICPPGEAGALAGVIRTYTGTPQLIERALIHLGKFVSPFPWPSAIVCQGVLQQYFDGEIQVILRSLLRRYPGIPILASVPSLSYGGMYRKGARLMAMDTWRYILQEFEIPEMRYYGPKHSHLFFKIIGFEPNIRGTAVKRLGKVNGGVWTPTDPNRV